MSKPSIGQLKTLVGVDTANPPVETVAVPPLHQAYIKTRDRNYFRFSYGILDKLGSGGESTIFRCVSTCCVMLRHTQFFFTPLFTKSLCFFPLVPSGFPLAVLA